MLGNLVARTGRTLIHVVRDDGRMARMRAALGFLHPELAVRTFTAWDSLPYDLVSPNPEIFAAAWLIFIHRVRRRRYGSISSATGSRRFAHSIR